ncbi:MarR family winged helix-turn-helix transcriptional regulator [Anaerostipes sp.]|uniref:MarR family winged helix-turn-helix transcriptional regulator n=1 Tax=Anaerostipes sp. TaxID=1872530 RepID=UPI0025C5523F|nr:MarR family transcriptional regulator [Anaerostipes sp.]MBS7007726.1 MarR family transcriptional regulator [Anaerostipes sp.]
MNEAESKGIAVSLFEIFPLCRELIFSSMDMKELNLTKSQLSILFALEVKPGLTMSKLSKYIASSKEQTTRAVAPLVKEGFVERYIEEENRRYVYIRLSDKGMCMIQEAKQSFINHLKLSFGRLPKEDLNELKQAAETTLRILKKLEP